MAFITKFASEIRVNDGTITAVLSSERRDRDGDIIRASGWDLTDFLKAPRLLSCHVYDDLLKHIGQWENVRVREDKLIGEPNYFIDSGNQEAIYGDWLARRGQATYSVGFLPIEHQPLKGYGTDFIRQALLETSHVPVPSNADALTLMAKAAKEWEHFRHAKWPSDLMDPDAPYNTGTHCIVPGCDDAAQVSVGICPEHLKYLMNAPAEPPGSPPDDDGMSGLSMGSGAAILDAFVEWSTKRQKAGARNSASDKAVIQTIHDHSGALGASSSDACAANSGDSGASGDNDKGAKAAPEAKPFDFVASLEAELEKALEAL